MLPVWIVVILVVGIVVIDVVKRCTSAEIVIVVLVLLLYMEICNKTGCEVVVLLILLYREMILLMIPA